MDEIGLVFNNRSFKEFSKDAINFFKLQRHYGVKVIACSQADDYDKVIRNLVDNLFLINNVGNVLSIARKVNRTVSIVSARDGAGESRIVEDLSFSHWLTIPFGGALFTWLPSWSKYFNSFDAPELPLKDFPIYYDERSDLYHVNVFSNLFSHLRYHSKFSDFKEGFHCLEDDFQDEGNEIQISEGFGDAATEPELVPVGGGKA